MRSPRVVVLCVIAALIFAASAAVLLRLLPAPLTSTDYLVAGVIATIAAMLVVFVALVATVYRSEDTFFKRRKRGTLPKQ